MNDIKFYWDKDCKKTTLKLLIKKQQIDNNLR
jgi:hypothetical protein